MCVRRIPRFHKENNKNTSLGTIQASAAEDWKCLLVKNPTCVNSVQFQLRRPTVPWAASKGGWPVEQEKWLFPCARHSWGPIWKTMLMLGAPNRRRMKSCWSRSRWRSSRWSGLEHLSVRQFQGVWLIQPGDNKTLGRPYSSLLVPKGSLQPNWEGTLEKTRGNSFKLNEGRFSWILGINSSLQEQEGTETGCPEKPK